MIRRALADPASPRGASRRLAEQLGVSPPTVSGYARGVFTPDMTRWPDIERFFGWEPGAIAAAVGAESAVDPLDRIRELEARLALLEDLVAAQRQTATHTDLEEARVDGRTIPMKGLP